MNTEPLIYWITERQNILLKKQAGAPPPLTDDPFLADWSFCNVRREDDRVTRWIAANWREPNASDPDLWFAMAVARYVNWPDTLAEIGFPVPWDADRFCAVMAARASRGELRFSPAYMIYTGAEGDKAAYLATHVLGPLWQRRAQLRPFPDCRLADWHARLTPCHGLSDFMAAQIVADIKYVAPLRDADDWWSFAASGPGSRRGLNRVLGRQVDKPWREADWRYRLGKLHEAIAPDIERIGIGRLHAQDLQNCLCEFDKYMRVKNGEGKPKKRYRPSAEPMPLIVVTDAAPLAVQSAHIAAMPVANAAPMAVPMAVEHNEAVATADAVDLHGDHTSHRTGVVPAMLTILSSRGKYATKQFTRQPDGTIKNRGYDSAAHFTVESIPIDGIHETARELERAAGNPFAFVIRGEPLPNINRARCRRLLHPDKSTGEPATFREEPRHHFIVDIDHIPCPAAIDPRSDPEGAVEYVIGLLPPELRDATCWWQLSSSQSVFDDATLSIHLWYWAERALASDELKRWGTEVNRLAGYKLIDTSLYNPVQAHYVAVPIFRNLADPLPRRTGLRQGLDDDVSLLIPSPDPKQPDQPCEGGWQPGKGTETYIAAIGGAEGFREPIKAAIAAFVAINGSKADATMLKAAIRAAVLRADTGGRDQETIERYADDDHLDAIIEWTRAQQGDRPGVKERRVDGDVIERFNAQYAVVNEAGQAVVYEQKTDPVLKRKVLYRIKFADLKKFYQNDPVTFLIQGKEVTRSSAEWWLDDRHRRQYLGGVVFDPTGAVREGCWNLWSGFGVEPTKGDWRLMHDHIDQVICSGVTEHRDYLLNTVAYMVQQPQRQAEVAVVLRGLKGSGKGVLCVSLRRMWGQHGLHITSPTQLVGKFNAHLRDCIYLFGDEAFYAGDRQNEGVLKGLITEPTIAVEGKYQNVVMAPNLLHIWMSSNNDWVVPASHDERRYFMQDVSPHRVGDRDYFTKLWAETEAGGIAAMLYDMLKRDIRGFDHRAIPQTAALAEQKRLSLDTLDAWWLAVLDRGFVWQSRHGEPEFLQWTQFVATDLLYGSYLQWHQGKGGYPASRELLGVRMKRLYTPSRPRGSFIIGEAQTRGEGLDIIITKDRPTGYVVGALEQARQSFADAYGLDWSRWNEADENGQIDESYQRRLLGDKYGLDRVRFPGIDENEQGGQGGGGRGGVYPDRKIC